MCCRAVIGYNLEWLISEKTVRVMSYNSRNRGVYIMFFVGYFLSGKNIIILYSD